MLLPALNASQAQVCWIWSIYGLLELGIVRVCALLFRCRLFAPFVGLLSCLFDALAHDLQHHTFGNRLSSSVRVLACTLCVTRLSRVTRFSFVSCRNAVLDYNAQSEHTLAVIVTVSWGSGLQFVCYAFQLLLLSVDQASNGGSSQGTVTVSVIQVDRAPVFSASIFNYTIPEGAVAGSALSSSMPVASTNPNARNVPVYRLLSSNPPTSNFVVDPLSGQLSLWAGISGGALTFNAGASYPLPCTFVLQISAQVCERTL